MKKKFPRILGVALTLMLLTSLTVGLAVAPASAATGKWNAFTLPAAGGPGGFVYSSDFEAAQYITKSIDGTLYCYNKDKGDRFLFKSTDDGRSWARVGGATINAKVLVDIVCSSKDANTLWVATATDIYVSTNAATSFKAMVSNADRSATALISSIDVGYVGDSTYVFMATADAADDLFGGLYVLGPAYGAKWGDVQVTDVNNALAKAETQLDVYDVAVMPDFETSQGLVAVVGCAGAQLYSVTKYAGANWGANVGRATLTGCFTPATSAQIAFPDDFSSVKDSGLMEYFVGVDAADSSSAVLEDRGTATAEWVIPTTDPEPYAGTYVAKLTCPAADATLLNEWSAVKVAYGKTLAYLNGLGYDTTDGGLHVLKVKFSIWYTVPRPYAMLWIDEDADGTIDTRLTSGFVSGEPGGGFETSKWQEARANYAAGWQLRDYDAGVISTYTGGYDGVGSPGNVSLANYLADEDCEGAIVQYVGAGYNASETAAYVDDIVIDGITYPVEKIGEGDATGDVFRIVQDKAVDRNVAGAAIPTRITGLDVVGNVGAAQIIAGKADALGTYVSTDNGATWTKSKKHPVGAGFAAWIVMASDFAESGKAWAATSGVGGGVYLTVDSGLEWDGVGLLDTDITGTGAKINDFAIGLGSETVFVAIKTVGDNDNLWRHDGTNWEQVYADQLGLDVDLVAVTDTFNADSTLFIADTTTKQIARSTDGSGRWSNQLGTPAAINSWLIQSPSAILVGGVNTVHQTTNNGTTWNNRAISAFDTIVSFAKSPEYATDTTVVCGSSNGKVARSINAGTNWSQIPAGAETGGDGNTFVAFNQLDANQVFAVTAGTVGGIFRYTFGATSWQDINDTGNTAPNDGTAEPPTRASNEVTAGSTGIVCAPDGALYVADVGTTKGMVRSINPTAALTPKGAAPYFEAVSTGLQSGAKTAGCLTYTPGSNKVWMFDNTAARKLWYYDDACTVAPTGLAASVGQTGGNLTWGAIDSATQYVIWYNRADLAWSGAIQDTSGTDGFNIAPGKLVSGTKYHFRVCVNTQKPALSPWSAAFEFTTAMGAAGWSPIDITSNVSPPAGATGVDPIQTLFQWNPSAGADGYEFQLADNAAFAGADTKKVKAPAYAWPGDLDYGKTYYWRVRAYKADSYSQWATAIFTTAEVPVAPAPPVVVAPPAAPPAAPVIPQAIPDYLLVTIIAIGAVLVIALIVLIVKTRRVA